MLTAAAAEAFAKEWIDAWNAHDLERILHHWDDDCLFSSPLVAKLLGEPSGQVRGKAALRAYWQVGLERNPNLHFDLDTVHVGHDSLVIAYRNHRGQRCAEMLRLGAHGRAVEGHAHYAG